MTVPPTTAATWQHDPVDNAYTLIQGEVRCRVWPSTIGGWAAVVSRRGIATASYNFGTPAEARTWCEQQVAAQR